MAKEDGYSNVGGFLRQDQWPSLRFVAASCVTGSGGKVSLVSWFILTSEVDQIDFMSSCFLLDISYLHELFLSFAYVACYVCMIEICIVDICMLFLLAENEIFLKA